MKNDFEIIFVLAGHSKNGPTLEELPARKLPGKSYLLLASPGLTLNIAKGDIIQLDENKKPVVIKRGGNFCIQIYSDLIDPQSVQNLEIELIVNLSGSLDGRHGGALSFSIPKKNGFEQIKKVFDKFTAITGIPWHYANIYKFPEDPEDDTLLNWWEEDE